MPVKPKGRKITSVDDLLLAEAVAVVPQPTKLGEVVTVLAGVPVDWPLRS
jgi:hypothetical protein